MNVVITRQVTKFCPHKEEVDIGTLELTFENDAPELHELAETIDKFGMTESTHEQYTRDLFSELHPQSIRTTWSTGPWFVECSAP